MGIPWSTRPAPTMSNRGLNYTRVQLPSCARAACGRVGGGEDREGGGRGLGGPAFDSWYTLHASSPAL